MQKKEGGWGAEVLDTRLTGKRLSGIWLSCSRLQIGITMGAMNSA